VNGVPSLSQNRFSCLLVEECQYQSPFTTSNSSDEATPIPPVLPPTPPLTPPPTPPRARLPHWERRLPKKYTLSSANTTNSIDLDIVLETTDTKDIVSVKALLDSGATGSFIDRTFADKHHFRTRPLSRPVPIYNIDGSLNEGGSITEIVDVELRLSGNFILSLCRLTAGRLLVSISSLVFQRPMASTR
jgi:Aspartyl protease